MSQRSCDWVREQLSLYVYGELPMESEESLEAHAAGCAACQELIAAERRMHAALDEAAEPLPAHLLMECRRALQVSLQAEAARRESVWGRLASFFAADAWIWKPVAACALLAAGFSGAKWHSQREMLQEMAQAPAGELRLVRSSPGGEVEIAYDVTQKRVVRGRVDDEAIRGLLLRAVTNAPDAGTRGQMAEALRGQAQSDDVRQALLVAAQKDPSAEVRVKALSGLRSRAGEMTTRRAFVNMLRQDSDLGVRTQAVDLLLLHVTPGRFDAEMIGGLQDMMRREENSYVRAQCQRALTVANASPFIF